MLTQDLSTQSELAPSCRDVWLCNSSCVPVYRRLSGLNEADMWIG